MNEIDSAFRFFYTGGALPPEAPSYIPRAADGQLFECLRHGDYCYVLVSRQMGKSSLMVRTINHLVQQNISAVMVDLNSIGDDLTQEQWYYSLAEQLAGQLDSSEQIEAYWDLSESKTALQKWVGALEQLLRLHPDRSLVIFIDEIDQVRSLPFKTDEFFAAIRSFHNRRAMDANFQHLTFCLIGVALPSDLIEDPRITPFNIAERIDLTDFTQQQVVGLKVGLQREEIQEEALLERVFYWTNGHPYLTQRLCRAIVEDPSVQMASDIDRLCGHLFFGEDATAPDDNINLVSARLLNSDPDIVGLLSLYKRISEGQMVRYDRADRLINILMLAGAVRSIGGNLQLRNRIYARVFDKKWISESMPGAEKRRLTEARRKGRIQVAAVALPVILIMSALTMTAVFYAQKAQRAAGTATKATGRANTLLYISDMKQIQQIWDNAPNSYRIGELLRETETLTDSNGKSCRGFEWNYWHRTNSVFYGTLEGGDIPIGSVSFSAEGRFITLISNRATRVWDEKTANIVYIPDRTSGVNAIARVWDARTGKLITIPDRVNVGNLSEISAAKLLEGRRTALGTADGTLNVLDIRTGKELFTLKGHTGRIQSMYFSKDRKRLITGSEDHTAKIWDVQSGKELLTLKGHAASVFCVAFTMDGKRVVTGSFDHTAKVWDAQTGKELLTLKGHDAFVRSVAFSADGTRIVTGSRSDARVWDAQTGKQLLTLPGHTKMIFSLAFSPDGKLIATGSMDNIARVWDAQNGKQLFTFKGHTNGISSMNFSPDNQRLVTGSWDQTVRVWDVRINAATFSLNQQNSYVSSALFSPDGQCIVTNNLIYAKVWDGQTGKELQTLGQDVQSSFDVPTVVSPDGRHVISGSWNHTGRIWDTITGKELLTLPDNVFPKAFSPDGLRFVARGRYGATKVLDSRTGQDLLSLEDDHASGTAVAFSPDSQRIVIGRGDHTATVWDAHSGKQQLTLKGHTQIVTALSFSPDNRYIVSGSGDHTARLWDAHTGKLLLTLPAASGPKERANFVLAVAFSPDGQRIATGSGRDAQIWDAQTGKHILTLKPKALVPPLERPQREGVSSVCFSPDGQRVVTGREDHSVIVWNAHTGAELLALKGHTARVGGVSFAAGGRRIVTVSQDDTVRVWDAQTGTNSLTLQAVTPVPVSYQGRIIVTEDPDRNARLWDTCTGKTLITLNVQVDYGFSAVVSPDGHRVIIVDHDRPDYTASIWDSHTGKKLFALDRHTDDDITCVLFSPDNRRIVTGSKSGIVSVWSAQTGRALLTFKGHTDTIRSIDFSPDGLRLITGSLDRTARVWDSQTGKELLKLKGQTSAVTSVVFSPDGRRIVTGSAEGDVKIWEVVTGAELLTLGGETKSISCIAFSPEGLRLVVRAEGKNAEVWDAR